MVIENLNGRPGLGNLSTRPGSATLRSVEESSGGPGVPKEVPSNPKFIFFQMKADRTVDHGYYHYSGPANAALAFGIPKNPNKPIRVAFSTSGGSIYHADLEGIAVPPNTGYQLVKGSLVSFEGKDKRAQRVLRITTLPEEHVRKMEQQGFTYPDPRILLPESTLASLCKLLKANSSEFVKDTTPDEIIHKAHTPPTSGGIEHLKWKFKNTSGD